MPTNTPAGDKQREELPLSKSAEYLLEECRMVLPGIQALFGFQLIAVFNQSFVEKLNPFEQRLHLAAIALIVLAVAIIMTPAALHRAIGPQEVTARFIQVSTQLLVWSMVPLALGICTDFYLVGRIILQSSLIIILAVLMFSLFLLLWFVLPRVRLLQTIVAGISK
jgi:hypothetical protein